MKVLGRLWEWLVKSSADANKWALTAKAVLYGIIPAVLYFTNLTHLQLSSVQLTQVVDLIAQLITYVGGAITALAFAWGVVRKIYTTLNGTNDVVESWSYHR